MKKVLLSSIIMFGICGFVTAQKTNRTAVKPNATTTTTAAAPVPQKAAVVTDQQAATSVLSTADGTVATDKKPVTAKKVTNRAAAASTTDAKISEDMAKKKELEKAKAAPAVKKDN